MRHRELFIVPESLARALHPEGFDNEVADREVVADVIDDMQQMGLFHLPFPAVDVRLVASGRTMVDVKGLHLIAPVNIQALRTPGALIPNYADGEVHFALIAAASDYMQAQTCCATVARMLIIALATANTEKRTVQNKRAALGIGKKENREYSRITYLNLPTPATDRKASDGEPGRSPRMHLRRGHARNQHFGKELQQIKRIWIAPVWVNADDEYVPREQYKVRMREEERR